MLKPNFEKADGLGISIGVILNVVKNAHVLRKVIRNGQNYIKSLNDLPKFCPFCSRLLQKQNKLRISTFLICNLFFFSKNGPTNEVSFKSVS